MAEEMELGNGTLPQEGGETTVMINVGSAETRNADKSFILRTHKLRNLAIASIICGCSCLGVLALIYAVKSREKQKMNSHDSAAYWYRKSRCMSWLSIGVWVSLLLLVPLLTILVSYIFSQAE
ncbi:PREDICTED: transmembrane protein 265 [Gekko japonicus]|uniref:Transmembrane protein 265 n=1 Tax=Gekko japonicus TaxID=146911 RepID=A0ABM1K1P7_GEKJA|nr:PREDICTED: transmembrane protein 265 [Gekko japonicus]